MLIQKQKKESHTKQCIYVHASVNTTNYSTTKKKQRKETFILKEYFKEIEKFSI